MYVPWRGRRSATSPGRSAPTAGSARPCQRDEDGIGDGLEVLIPVGIGADFDGLCGLAGGERVPVGNVEESARRSPIGSCGAAVERACLVSRVHQLGDRAPAGGWPHLKQPEGVVVGAASLVRVVGRLWVCGRIRQHSETGLGECGHERDERSGSPDAGGLRRDRDDGCRMSELLSFEHDVRAIASLRRQRVRNRTDRERAGRT